MSRRRTVLRKTLACALVLIAHPTPAADWRGSARIGLSGGADTNPARDYRTAASTDGFFLEGRGNGEGRLEMGSTALSGRYDLAGRVFTQQFPQSLFAQGVGLDVAHSPLPWLSVLAEGRFKMRRGAARDYTDGSAGVGVGFLPSQAWDISLSANAHRFLYWPSFRYSFGAPEVSLQARWRFLPKHQLYAASDLGFRTYSGPARDASFVDTALQRRDIATSTALGYRFRGPVALGLEYRFSLLASNSVGESMQRHRIFASVGVALPWELFLLGQASIQFTRFPDGVFLSPEVFLIDDDESLNSATLKVARPLTRWLDIEMRYALVQGALPTSGLAYLRHSLALGLQFRIQ
ncbi:MAG: hypothetical protein ACKVPX_13840 [Myxococcaceae bacterium]